jgi:hypothetical protein
MLSFAFIIFGQTAVAAQPGKGSLDHPALWEDFEAGAGLFDDLEGKAPAWNQVSSPVEEFASISSVGEVLHSGAVNDHGKNEFRGCLPLKPNLWALVAF